MPEAALSVHVPFSQIHLRLNDDAGEKGKKKQLLMSIRPINLSHYEPAEVNVSTS